MKRVYRIFIHVVVLVQSVLLYQLYFNYMYTKNTIEVMIKNITNNMVLFYQNALVSFIKFKGYFLNNDLMLSNRQLAILIWSIVAILILLREEKVKNSFFNVLKVFFSRKLLIIWLSAVGYNILIILLMRKLGLWNITHLKVTILWLLFVGFIMLFFAIGDADDNRYFINIIIQNIKVTIVFQFIMNLHSFALLIELIIVPITVFVSMMIVIAEYRDKGGYKKVATFSNAILIIIGLSMMWNSIAHIVSQFNELNFEKLFILMSMGSVLSILFIPFLICIAVLSAYEILFIRLSFKKTIAEEIRKRLYFKIILACGLNVSKIKNFIQDSDIMHRSISNRVEIKRLISDYKYK
ncbi:hypothetical protein G9F72_006040 [Clostridium estertheticum]|uniref:hypothetical protein n=1 Tax=Clostridium estertheticum TaxID=238834 RepID=UPI0013E94268|nr:hypothetical protein [Clostridium estertheticum]MBZ9685902.1 hypothetical protein [Clostridium estertheticum]